MPKIRSEVLGLDIGGGGIKYGWITIDLNPASDIPHDLNNYPWPIESNSQSYIRMSHILEHLDDPLKAMKECFRIARNGATLEVRVPWWKDDMFSWPVHKWHFKPIYFHRLRKGAGNPLSIAQTGDMNWVVRKEHTLRGSRRFWKKYQYTVYLEAVKG